MTEEKIEEMFDLVKETRDALLGTYEKKGLISRVDLLERYVKVQWGIISAIVVAVASDIVKGLF